MKRPGELLPDSKFFIHSPLTSASLCPQPVDSWDSLVESRLRTAPMGVKLLAKSRIVHKPRYQPLYNLHHLFN